MGKLTGGAVKYYIYRNKDVSTFNFQGTDRRKETEKHFVP